MLDEALAAASGTSVLPKSLLQESVLVLGAGDGTLQGPLRELMVLLLEGSARRAHPAAALGEALAAAARPQAQVHQWLHHQWEGVQGG